MADLVLPNDIVAGSQILSLDHRENYTAIEDHVNALLDGPVGAYRVITTAIGNLQQGDTSSPRYFNYDGVPGYPDTVPSGTSSTTEAAVFWALDPSDYAVDGYATRYRIRAGIAVNAAAPAITFTYGLYPVTLAGASNTITPTLGTVVSGSTASIASPAANAGTMAVGSDFTPPTAGVYMPGVAISGTMATNSYVYVMLQLQVRNI